MNSHCKGCQYHWNAGHPKDHVLAKDHNDWCTKYGKTARTIIGHCKLHDGKHVARDGRGQDGSPSTKENK